mmetsp:Transcript_24317/g.43241  ORF Transcript_24317/g.43241 Transcript_24317/m.43241 type:complete len:152 (+) Transcript_24317:123-578(+)
MEEVKLKWCGLARRAMKNEKLEVRSYRWGGLIRKATDMERFKGWDIRYVRQKSRHRQKCNKGPEKCYMCKRDEELEEVGAFNRPIVYSYPKPYKRVKKWKCYDDEGNVETELDYIYGKDHRIKFITVDDEPGGLGDGERSRFFRTDYSNIG